MSWGSQPDVRRDKIKQFSFFTESVKHRGHAHFIETADTKATSPILTLKGTQATPSSMGVTDTEDTPPLLELKGTRAKPTSLGQSDTLATPPFGQSYSDCVYCILKFV